MSRQPPRRGSVWAGLFWFLACLVGGLLQAASLAWPLQAWVPPGLSPGQPSGVLQVGSLALMVLALQQSSRLGMAVWRGWVFATAWLAGTFWWLFISLHTYGGLAAWLAVVAVLALAGALALYYAAATGVLAWLAPRSRVGQALLFAAAWTLAELMRGQWFTGFPWGAGGYAQVDLLAPWAPWLGVYGMGAIAALLAYALASTITAAVRGLLEWLTRPVRLHRAPPSPYGRAARAAGGWIAPWRQPLVVAASIVVLVALAWPAQWLPDGQRDTSGAGAMRVWLLQGNIAQNEKFVEGTGMAQALAWYPDQIAAAVRATAAGAANAPQLVVAPETALPLLPAQFAPDFWPPLLGGLAQPGVREPLAVLLGLPLGSYTEGYTNSAWGLDAATASHALAQGKLGELPANAFYRYDKHHLVPFGEFIPPMFRWFIQPDEHPVGRLQPRRLPQASWTVRAAGGAQYLLRRPVWRGAGRPFHATRRWRPPS